MARNVFVGPIETAIYDVSDLVDKHPKQDVGKYSLGNLTLPANDNTYIDFGRIHMTPITTSLKQMKLQRNRRGFGLKTPRSFKI
ncbi:hypothetical protein MZK49_08080 [Ensifer sesbaniae]|uniref:hypothetical protein n=1 Tax=Ensifer sesbaniae TaxID=1214071 RepID=UPI00200162C4|nr:hypothetical protein [Ensifer sesbaniae]